jgi:hypothetical protein
MENLTFTKSNLRNRLAEVGVRSIGYVRVRDVPIDCNSLLDMMGILKSTNPSCSILRGLVAARPSRLTSVPERPVVVPLGVLAVPAIAARVVHSLVVLVVQAIAV